MTKKMLLGLALILLSLTFVVAQEQSLIVRIDDSGALKASAARLNVVSKSKGKVEKDFLLSFQTPNLLQTDLPKTEVTLTAYKKDGSVFGKQIWYSASKGMVNEFSANDPQIVLDTNPNLQGASSYSLFMDEPQLDQPAVSFQDCVNAANDVCGRGNVGSLNSGADGSCSFTCK